MNDLPAGWRRVRLGDVAEVQGGIQKQAKRRPVLNHYPFLRVANVARGWLNLGGVHRVELFDRELERYRLRPGDLLVVEGNGSPDQIGRAATWDGSIDDCVHQNHLIRVRPGGDLVPAYLAHVWNSPEISAHLMDVSSSSSGLHTLSTAKIKSVTLPVPPLGEQRRIVDVLEDHLSRLDAATAYLWSARRRCMTYSNQVISRELVGGGGDVEPASALLAPAGTVDGTLAPLPPGWSWQRLCDLASVVGGVTKDSKKQADPELVEVPYLRVANVQRGRLDLNSISRIRVAPSKLESLRLLPGDVLMNEGGDRDKLARGWVWDGEIEDCIHQNHVFRARVVGSSIHPKLLSWAANSIGAEWASRNGKQSVNLASISLSKIKLMPVPVPPVDDQARIVQRIEERLAVAARAADAIAEQERRSAALRRALLTAAFSGRLTGRSTDAEVVEEIADSQVAS